MGGPYIIKIHVNNRLLAAWVVQTDRELELTLLAIRDAVGVVGSETVGDWDFNGELPARFYFKTCGGTSVAEVYVDKYEVEGVH